MILGGGSNARDLIDLATLIGDRDEELTSVSRDHHGGRSTSSSIRRVPVMDTSRLRTLPFGTGVLLLRTAPPVVLDLVPWTVRPLVFAALAVARELRTRNKQGMNKDGEVSSSKTSPGPSAPSDPQCSQTHLYASVFTASAKRDGPRRAASRRGRTGVVPGREGAQALTSR